MVDDGSTDRTVEVASAHGVTEIVHHARNQGLGRSFHDGVVRALELDADIVVNTDGDNQYPQERIADLVQPIVTGHADIVIADRQVHLVEHFSPVKKLLQKLGSRIVNLAAGTDLPDAASGFRAYSRESLMLLNTITRFSYCMETIIQAGNKKLKIESIPVPTNPKTRESRLFGSTREHVLKSAAAIIRAFIMYRPYVIFAWLTVVFGVLGLAPFVRYAVLMIKGRRGRPPAVVARRCCAARDGVPEHHARRDLRPDPHQPGAHRDEPRAHQATAFRALHQRRGGSDVRRPGGDQLQRSAAGMKSRVRSPV